MRLHDGSTRTARVERTAPEVDLAVLRVSGMTVPPHVLALKSADQVRPGQEVIAIGSALGLQSTVTRGIVSARRLAGAVLLLQTDAAINPGNSGGPLLDRDGSVVGVTTLKMGSGAEGLGFAVAADHVRALLDGRALTSSSSTSSASPQPPLAAAVPAFGDDRSADGQRVRGQEAYAREITRLVQHAAQIDAQWARFDGTCAPQPSREGDRPWFAIAGRAIAFSSGDRNCPVLAGRYAAHESGLRDRDAAGHGSGAPRRRLSRHAARPAPPASSRLVRLRALARSATPG